MVPSQDRSGSCAGPSASTTRTATPSGPPAQRPSTGKPRLAATFDRDNDGIGGSSGCGDRRQRPDGSAEPSGRSRVARRGDEPG